MSEVRAYPCRQVCRHKASQSNIVCQPASGSIVLKNCIVANRRAIAYRKQSISVTRRGLGDPKTQNAHLKDTCPPPWRACFYLWIGRASKEHLTRGTM